MQPDEIKRLAQDALELLKENRLKAKKGLYVMPENGFMDPELTKGDLLAGRPGVCAKGALLVAQFIRSERESFGSVFDALCDLQPLFDPCAWNAVEHCFEADTTFQEGFGYAVQFETAQDRLQAILENLVRNDGAFRPEQDLKGPCGTPGEYIDNRGFRRSAL